MKEKKLNADALAVVNEIELKQASLRLHYNSRKQNQVVTKIDEDFEQIVDYNEFNEKNVVEGLEIVRSVVVDLNPEQILEDDYKMINNNVTIIFQKYCKNFKETNDQKEINKALPMLSGIKTGLSYVDKCHQKYCTQIEGMDGLRSNNR